MATREELSQEIARKERRLKECLDEFRFGGAYRGGLMETLENDLHRLRSALKALDTVPETK